MDELTDKQKRFVDEYLVDFNGKQSAIRAGYAERSAETTASRLLRNDKVQQALAKRKKDMKQRNELTIDRIVEQYMKIAFGDIKDIVTWEDERGRQLLKLQPMDKVDGTIIDEIKETITESGGTLTVKRSDRMKALEMLAKYTGMLDEKPQTQVDVTQYIKALTGTAKNVWGGDNGDEKER